MSSSPFIVLKADAVVAVKVMLNVQVAPPAREFPQLLVCENTPLLIVTEDKYKGASPRLVSVTVCGSPGSPTIFPLNVREDVESDPRADEPAEPLRATVRLTPLVPFTVSTPVRSPLIVGVKVTKSVQEDPPATPTEFPGAPSTGHVEVWAKSPVIWMLVI